MKLLHIHKSQNGRSDSPDRRRTSLVILVGILLAGIVVFSLLWDNIHRSTMYFKHGYGCKNCNVLLISIDTLRADQVGLYRENDASSPTPHIDAFFSKGTVFDRAMSTSPCTDPSIIQFLIGAFEYKPDRPRIAQLLKAGGYDTAAVVSQGILGFSDMLNPLYTAGFDEFDIQKSTEVDRHDLSTRQAKDVTDRALTWLEKHGTDRKFFLWTHYFDPHDPYAPPRKYVSREIQTNVLADGDRRARLMDAKSRHPNQKFTLDVPRIPNEEKNSWRFYGHIFNGEAVRVLEELYRDEIVYVDDQVHRLLQSFESKGLLENTVVLFTADHGERLGEDNIWDHCLSLHAREIHVPLMIRVRGERFRNLERVTTPVSTLDIVPTVLSLLSYKAEAVFDGKNLNTAAPRGPVYAFWEDGAVVLAGEKKLYSTSGAYKTATITGPSEEKPSHRNETSDDYRTMKKDLEAFVKKQKSLMDAYKGLTERLRNLGYID